MNTAFFHATKGLAIPKGNPNPFHPKTHQNPRTHLTKRHHRVLCAADRNNLPNDDDDDDDQDLQTSRRVFLAGISATTLITAFGGYRFVVGEDIESRVKSRIVKRFPAFFPRESTPDERRRPLYVAFAEKYFNALEQVAVQMRLLTASDLHREESIVKTRAFGLFFNDDDHVVRNLSNTAWLNFLLYSRLHVISQHTSPQSRLEFVDFVSTQMLAYLQPKPHKLSKEQARQECDRWLVGLHNFLDEVVALGWISGYRIEDFDGGPGSSWQDENRAALTVYAFDPITIQAAQLIGEEQYEEISPKLSGWIKAFLHASGIGNISFEDYYLDDTYRPDPEQFKPSQIATQFDLSL